MEAAEAEKITQLKMNKKARSAAARKRKLEQMVAEDENLNQSPPCAKPHRKQKQVQTKGKAQEKGPSLALKNPSNKPITPKNKPGMDESVANLSLVASSSPIIFNSSPLASRDRKSTRLNSSHVLRSRMPSSA